MYCLSHLYVIGDLDFLCIIISPTINVNVHNKDHMDVMQKDYIFCM